MLPDIFSFENGGNKQVHEKEKLKNLLAELEQLLIHANIPVSVTKIIFLRVKFCLHAKLLLATICLHKFPC